MSVAQTIDSIFHPKSIALIGISPVPGGWTQMFPDALQELDYDGKVYFVSRGNDNVCDSSVYPSIKEVPGPVDYAICSVAALFAPKLIEDCASKGVKAVHLFTAGFRETGKEEGALLEERISRIARETGVRIIGPNCVGIYCPESKLSFSPNFPKESGPVGCISQSGGNCIRFLRLGAVRGLRYSKAVSYGNGCDLGATEFLEYLAHDLETRVIALCIEGVRDGRRFLEVLARAAKMKPVIIYKGGYTEAGRRASTSHTGSLSGEEKIWNALCRQAGAIRVHSVGELVDTVLTFVFMPVPKGNMAAIVGYGGGLCVQATDQCESSGLSVPLFPEEIRDRLESFTPDAGNSVRNPVDIQWSMSKPDKFVDTVRIISQWEGIDFFIVLLTVDIIPTKGEHELLDKMVESVIKAREACSKPMAVVLHEGTSPETLARTFLLQQTLSSYGLPVYPTIGRATQAIGRFIRYHHPT
ncbi:MAG: CoA-binding protein [Pseudomonadota bacterium]